MCSTILERQAGTSDEVANSLRHENLAGYRKASNTGSNVNGNASKIITDQFAFARMNAAAHLQVKRPHRMVKRIGAPDRSCGPFKCRKKTIARSAYLSPAIVLQYFAGSAIELVMAWTSCIRCSSVKSWEPRSDMPVPRLSKRIRRQNEARRR